MALLDTIRKLTNAERREVQALLTAPPREEREVLEASERARLADELHATVDSVQAERDAAAREIAEAEAELQAARERYERAHGTAAGIADRGPALNDLRSRLWAGRLPHVDVILARLEDEARALWPPATYRIPGSLSHPEIVVSNGASTERRQRALRELGELVKSWTRNAGYTDVAELDRMFKAEYSKLPRVESPRAVAARMPQARAHRGLVDRLLRSVAGDQPPAA